MKDHLSTIKRVLIYCGLTQEEYSLIRQEIIEENRKLIMLYSILTGSAMAVFAIATFFFLPDYHSRLPFFQVSAVLLFSIAYLSATASKKWPQHIKTTGYMFAAVLFASSIFLSAIEAPDAKTVAFIACILALPMMFFDLPIRIIMAIVIADIIFIIVDINCKILEVALNDILNCLVFSVISCFVSTYMIISKAKKHLYESRILILSETDQLTGLKNRNYFEFRKHDYPQMCKMNVSCIYVDANGLHQLNNEYGHAAGDDMLKFIGAALQEEFGKMDTYRIGGDEFVAFVTDISEKEIQKRIMNFRDKVARKTYHASLGSASLSVPDIDMNTLIRNAEARMYEDKADYYRQTGEDRRSRPYTFT